MYLTNSIRLICLTFALALLTGGTTWGDDAADRDRPNVVVMMADDLGYADLGCYGGEIETPNLDQLASQGVRFSQFRASPMCVTSRVAMMAGMPFNRAGRNGYSHSFPLPMLLKQSGYRTMMVGKWHAGNPDPRSKKLFDRSFGFLSGMTDSFAGADDWFLDDRQYKNFPPGFYATTAFADRSIEFMKEAVEKQQPFFMFVAFNAPHHPCQAPQQTVEKYLDRYAKGYTSIRNRRHQRQIEIGLVDEKWPLAPVGNEARRWDELTDHRKQVEAGRMAAYAAAVDEVDQQVGNIIDYLNDAQIADNTVVIFVSDNGGDYNNGSIATDEKQIAWLPGSNPTPSNGWASVKNTPFRFYKHACHEGGLAVPMILWAGEKTGIAATSASMHPPGSILHASANITDLYPTVLEIAGVDYPRQRTVVRAGNQTIKKPLRSLTGAPLQPLLKQGGTRVSRPFFSWFNFSAGWIDGDWKAVRLYGGPWQLYNLAEDRCETIDLATQHPDRLAQLIKCWSEFASASDVSLADQLPIDQQIGWGWHRLQMVCPEIKSVTPPLSGTSKSREIELRLEFGQPVDFEDTPNQKIQLFDVSDESNAIWELDPDESHPSQGKRVVVFDDLPRLKPDHHYFVLWDSNWVKVGDRPVNALNDGAFWWRFRTPSESK